MTGPAPSIEGLAVNDVPKGRVQRAKPAPFSRPSITIGGGIKDKRVWKTVPVHAIKEGDTIPGLGTVTRVVENIETHRRPREGAPHIIEASVQWAVIVYAGEGNERAYKGSDEIWCFTR